VVSSLLMLARVEPVASWYYCFVWWSTIILVDAVGGMRGRPSLWLERPRDGLALAAWSATLWFAFELANHRLHNWSYVGAVPERAARWPGTVVAFATVLPAVVAWAGLLDSLAWLRTWRIRARPVSRGLLQLLVWAGVALTALSLALPVYAFPLIWVGPTLVLAGLDGIAGGDSLIGRTLGEGRPRRLVVLLAAGAVCGLLWELYNFGARAKWLYTVPGFEDLKLFEMPLAGFLGFPPFAVACYLFIRCVGEWRGAPLWDFDPAACARPASRRPLWARAALIVLMPSFWLVEMAAMDRYTVWSQRPLVSKAKVLPFVVRARLDAAGYQDLEDVAMVRAAAREDLCELIQLPAGDCMLLFEVADLASLKGLGLEGLRLLHASGVRSVRELAAEQPDQLAERMTDAARSAGVRAPGRALVRLWVRAARKASHGS
jgi:hypothetical protein